jgi:hypothetical protein
MNKKQIIGIILIILSLLLITSYILIKYTQNKHTQNGGNNQKSINSIKPTDTSEPIKVTKEQKKEGIISVYNDTQNGVLIVDK